jgi:hypothetical protein
LSKRLQAPSASTTTASAANRVAARAQLSTLMATDRPAMDRMNPVPDARFNRFPLIARRRQ